MLEVFHFDIIIIIVILYSIIIGMYRGLYKQLLSTLALAIPIIIIYFFYNVLNKGFDKIPYFDYVIKYFHKGGRHFLNLSIENTRAFLIIIISFFVIYSLIQLILRFFIVSKKHNIAIRMKLGSRFIGVALGLCNGYVILIIILVLTTPLITTLGTGPIYSILIKIIPKVFLLRTL